MAEQGFKLLELHLKQLRGLIASERFSQSLIHELDSIRKLSETLRVKTPIVLEWKSLLESDADAKEFSSKPPVKEEWESCMERLKVSSPIEHDWFEFSVWLNHSGSDYFDTVREKADRVISFIDQWILHLAILGTQVPPEIDWLDVHQKYEEWPSQDKQRKQELKSKYRDVQKGKVTIKFADLYDHSPELQGYSLKEAYRKKETARRRNNHFSDALRDF